MKSIYRLLIITFIAAGACGQTDHDKMDHDKMIQENGEKAMGFSQTAPTHHFLVMKDGGANQIEVNDPKDGSNRDKIRMHLQMIAKQFQQGVFTTPFAVHGVVSPGAADMEKLKSRSCICSKRPGRRPASGS